MTKIQFKIHQVRCLVTHHKLAEPNHKELTLLKFQQIRSKRKISPKIEGTHIKKPYFYSKIEQENPSNT